ncbi:MAG TPA: DNA-binding protein [Thermoproteota archaeon]|nr:DNA-binding protein [Thermoproteota archaeon]
MAEDRELERIKREKMQRYAEKAKQDQREAAKPQTEESVDDVVYSLFYDRASEVMRAAELQYPPQAEAVKTGLYKMIKSGRLVDKIDGGTLLTLFRTLGIPVHVDTSVKFVEHGKAKSLADKLSESWSD